MPFLRAECPIGANGLVCSGQGVCGYDQTAGTARCYCNSNYRDANCVPAETPKPAGAIAGSAIGGLSLGALAVAGFSFFYFRSRAPAAPVDGFYGQ